MSYMTIRPIKTEDDLALALGRIDELIDAKVDTPEADELDVLSQLVELCEDKNWPIGLPSPFSAKNFLMAQSGLNEQDFVPFIGDLASVADCPHDTLAPSEPWNSSRCATR